MHSGNSLCVIKSKRNISQSHGLKEEAPLATFNIVYKF